MYRNRITCKLRTYSKIAAVVLSSVYAQSSYAQTEDQRRVITRDYDQPALIKLSEASAKEAADAKKSALEFARLRNLPVLIDLPDGGKAELMFIDPAGKPVYFGTDNAAAAITTRVNHLNTGGSTGLNLDGQNMMAYIWDGGYARMSHQEYDGPGGADRVQVMDTVAEGGYTLDSHGAHVTGTIVASGVTASAKGMAPQARLRGYKWNSDLSEATSAAANGMLLSNHSYGYVQSSLSAYYFGGYLTVARDWDNVMYNAPYYLMIKSAGNNGTTTYNTSPLDPAFPQYDKLTDRANCKNNLVIASCNDAAIDAAGNLTSVTISSFSSQGPTDDLRIKPDITANGASLYSTVETADNAYGSKSGTSMASPNTTGTLLLLQQHAYQTNGAYLRAATLKGLVLHTADDVGMTGPDAIWGWGLLNGKKAAATISQNGNQSIINELTLAQGQTYSFQVTSDGINKLMASVSWTDPAGTASTALNSTTPRLVNDLDIRITQNSSTYLPWMLTGVNTNSTGDNVRDPYERIDISSATGTYTVTISHKGTLSSGSQRFSLIVTGVVNANLCTASVPVNLTTTQLTATAASFSWDPVPFASYEFRYRPAGGLTWTTVPTTVNSVSVQGLSQATAYEAEVRSICPGGSTSAFSATLNFTTPAIVITYCNSAGTSTAREYINRVQVGSINNTSGNNNGYGNYLSLSAAVVRGSAYTVTIVPGWTANARSEAYRVWIDYNKDGDFLDGGEQVYARNKTTAASVSGSFTIPLTATIGTTRMRVAMKYNSNPTSCETFAYGEVEDYTISITAPANKVAVQDEPLETGVEFFLHPNPAKQTLNLSFKEIPSEFEWMVLDLTGRKVMEGHDDLRIDVSMLPGGTYLLMVRKNGTQSTERFIKE